MGSDATSGPFRAKEKRDKERSELRDLIGKNLLVLGQIDGVDLDMYKNTVLPRVLEQVVNCKDDLAQHYLMDCIIQVFPDEYHLQTLETLLGACPQLQINCLQVVVVGMGEARAEEGAMILDPMDRSMQMLATHNSSSLIQ